MRMICDDTTTEYVLITMMIVGPCATHPSCGLLVPRSPDVDSSRFAGCTSGARTVQSLWGFLGASWEPLGSLLGASLGLFGAFWGPLGTSWAVLGRSYAVWPLRRPSWRPLAAALGLSWGPLGPFWEPIGPSWGPLLAVSGPSWAVLGTPWGPLGPSWGLLGGCLGRHGLLSAEKSENVEIVKKP